MALALTFLQATSSISDLSAYTFSSQNLGTASSDRYIIVAAMSRKAGASTTISSITVGGVTATIVVQRTNNITNTDVAGIAIAAVPSGTTGDVVVTFGATMARCAISMWAATGINPTAYDSASSVASAPTANLNIASGGAAIGAAITAANSSATWTGLTENSDAVVESFITATTASASSMSVETGRTITATFLSSTEPAGVFASFQPSGGTATNSERTAKITGKDTSSAERSVKLLGGVSDTRDVALTGAIGSDNDFLSYMQQQNGDSWASCFKAHDAQYWFRGITQDVTAIDRDFELSRVKFILHWSSEVGLSYHATLRCELRTAYNGSVVATSINTIDAYDVDIEPGYTEVWFYFERGVVIPAGSEYTIGIYGDEAELVNNGGDLEAFFYTGNGYSTDNMWQNRSTDSGSSWGWQGSSTYDLYFAAYQWGQYAERTAKLTGYIPDLYTKEYNATLPTVSDDLSTTYTGTEVTNVGTSDNTYTTEVSTGVGYILHQFDAANPDFAQQEVTVNWEGKSTLAPTISPVYLQVWNSNTSSWETLDSDSATAANTDFTLSGNINTNYSYYYDANYIVRFRVYQHV